MRWTGLFQLAFPPSLDSFPHYTLLYTVTAHILLRDMKYVPHLLNARDFWQQRALYKSYIVTSVSVLVSRNPVLSVLCPRLVRSLSCLVQIIPSFIIIYISLCLHRVSAGAPIVVFYLIS